MGGNSVVVIPTYNAKKSIVKAIQGVLKKLPSAKVIIVDDKSPDGTYKIIQTYFKADKRVVLIIRKSKSGRGSAVLRGFKEGLKDKSRKFFIEMDADLCHNPHYLPLLIKECRTYDVAIASKYLKGSKIIGLHLKRKIFSRLVNLYTKFMLQIPITDYTNGYRCYRRKALETINFKNIKSRGFIVLSELVYNIYKKGFALGEIPIVFRHYNLNKSNFNFSEIKEAFLTILRLKLRFK